MLNSGGVKPEDAAGVEVYGDGGGVFPVLPELASTEVVVASDGGGIVVDTAQEATSRTGSSNEMSGKRSSEGRRLQQRMLQISDELFTEIYHLQRPMAPLERKSERQLLRLKYSEAEVWRDELKVKSEARDRERTQQFDARVAEAVGKTMARAPLAPSEKEQELEVAFQTSLATAHAGLDAERQANEELRAKLAKLELARANSPQEPVARQQVTHADVPPVEDRSRKSGWLWSTAGIIGAILVGGILICGFALLITRVYTEVKSRKAPAETVNSQSNEKETAVQMSRRTSMPSQDELDNHPAVVRTKALIERNRKLLK